ncbi:MAG TPA: hypothetical protein VF021_05825 [Longimicrobiales bacterium]
MRKVLPYIGAGAAIALLLFFLLKIAFPGGNLPEVKRLAAQVDTLKLEARVLRDTVDVRDRRINSAMSEIAALNAELDRVRASNTVILGKLNQNWRIHDKSDAELIAGLNRAHGDSLLLKGSGPVPR